MQLLRRLTEPSRLSTDAWIIATAIALAVGVGGYFHGHLLHEGYSQIAVVGPLFLLNVVGSAIVVGLLILRRAALFVVGALVISAGSLISILISHTSSFFGFAENSFDTRAVIIVVAEIVATVLSIGMLARYRRELLTRGAQA